MLFLKPSMRFLKLACAFSIFLSCALAQPSVANGGVLNGGSFVVGQAVSPGSVVSIFGSGLANATLIGDTIPLSASLGGTSVFFNGEQAPLYFVSAGQINAVAINNADNSIAAPVGAIPGITTHPAKAGDVMVLYANGLGPVGLDGKTVSEPPLGAASLDATRYTTTIPTLLIGGTQAQLIFSGLTPQFVGISQINFIVPQVTPGSSIPIQLVEGGITTTDKVVIAIQ